MQPYLDKNQFYREKRKFRIKVYLVGGALVLSAIGIFYVVVYSPVFQIRKFQISGVARLNDEAALKILKPLILDNRLANFLGINNLLVWRIKNPDVQNTSLAQAIIKRDWLRQEVKIQVEERPRIAIWCSQKDFCYWIDQSGADF